jgi:hypothetical protein
MTIVTVKSTNLIIYTRNYKVLINYFFILHFIFSYISLVVQINCHIVILTIYNKYIIKNK